MTNLQFPRVTSGLVHIHIFDKFEPYIHKPTQNTYISTLYVGAALTSMLSLLWYLPLPSQLKAASPLYDLFRNLSLHLDEIYETAEVVLGLALVYYFDNLQDLQQVVRLDLLAIDFGWGLALLWGVEWIGRG